MSYQDPKIIKVIKSRRPKVVVIGGGTGLPVILNALKKQNAEITAIVTVSDDGGSSGSIRNFINVVPPGDIRNVLVSLSDLPQEEKDIFQYRFDSSDSFFSGHAIGNLIIAALNEMDGNIFDAVQALSRMMRVDGHVFPASNEPLTLNAEFVDGTTEVGETEITAKDKRIKRVWVTDTDSGNEPKSVLPVLAAIMQADAVVLGPGSLFTSILPNLMIPDVAEAVRKTQAEVIYICNIMTQQGETDHFSDSEHVAVINKHLKGEYIDTTLVNGAKIDMSKFNPKDYDAYLEPVRNDFAGLRKQNCRVVTDDFIDQRSGLVFHDGKKVAKEIINLAFESMLRRRATANNV
ncbi:YvcK family protein [Lactobacillus sp. ESL0791]|uniref:gluconeogenesis factor YvcK family protein n=1 Tax=Lactobacillus sp. ESL0791 TaxID=2983234 RepID=UPI0023F817FC|nr:gluconeogenesis factor YvcK family protein [Lactobacillus sp. ESL0791]MDF7638593.1 YvcK family protein [Lactobacillus sp. ESL0791]